MGSLSLRKCVSRDHDKGPRARQLWIHQDIRAVLASRHAGCGGAVPGGARTFHGLCIACAARVDRRLVPETQTSIKPASGSPKTCREARCCPRRRWQWLGCTQPQRPLLQPSRHHTTPPTDCGPMVHPWEHPCAINHANSSCRGRATQQQRSATDLARCKVQEPALICA